MREWRRVRPPPLPADDGVATAAAHAAVAAVAAHAAARRAELRVLRHRAPRPGVGAQTVEHWKRSG